MEARHFIGIMDSAIQPTTISAEHFLNVIHCRSPAYIADNDMLTAAGDVPSLATLRATSNGDYIVPRTNSRFGDRAFLVAAPRAWNRLPADLKTASCSYEVFKRRLNTFLFNCVYCD